MDIQSWANIFSYSLDTPGPTACGTQSVTRTSCCWQFKCTLGNLMHWRGIFDTFGCCSQEVDLSYCSLQLSPVAHIRAKFNSTLLHESHACSLVFIVSVTFSNSLCLCQVWQQHYWWGFFSRFQYSSEPLRTVTQEYCCLWLHNTLMWHFVLTCLCFLLPCKCSIVYSYGFLRIIHVQLQYFIF